MIFTWCFRIELNRILEQWKCMGILIRTHISKSLKHQIDWLHMNFAHESKCRQWETDKSFQNICHFHVFSRDWLLSKNNICSLIFRKVFFLLSKHTTHTVSIDDFPVDLHRWLVGYLMNCCGILSLRWHSISNFMRESNRKSIDCTKTQTPSKIYRYQAKLFHLQLKRAWEKGTRKHRRDNQKPLFGTQCFVVVVVISDWASAREPMQQNMRIAIYSDSNW